MSENSVMKTNNENTEEMTKNIVLIGSLGLTALVGFYILNKKKEA
jgi:LPXTG-motif cell wall-anchored protein